MAKRTLWERITGKEPPVDEDSLYNPMKAKLTSLAILDDYGDTQFVVKEIREVARSINTTDFKFADYLLESLDKKIQVRLRCNPDDKLPDGFSALLLTPFDELSYDKGLFDLCESGDIFHIDREGAKEAGDYLRIGDVKGVQEEEVRTLYIAYCRKPEQNCNASNIAIKTDQMQSWDYSRTTKDDAGQDYEQFLFVEMDTDCGRFYLLTGQATEPGRISIT